MCRFFSIFKNINEIFKNINEIFDNIKEIFENIYGGRTIRGNNISPVFSLHRRGGHADLAELRARDLPPPYPSLHHLEQINKPNIEIFLPNIEIFLPRQFYNFLNCFIISAHDSRPFIILNK